MKPTVILIMGVAGSGKSTIGKGLAHQLEWAFHDADDFHPASNIEKMTAGTPLTDEDRLPWLQAIRTFIDASIAQKNPCIITCSALKASYREILLTGQEGVRLVFLKGSYELIEQRMLARTNHFMAPGMLRSQFEALEEPSDAASVDIDDTPDRIVLSVRKMLNL